LRGNPALCFGDTSLRQAIVACGGGMKRSPEGETGETNQAPCRGTRLCTIG